MSESICTENLMSSNSAYEDDENHPFVDPFALLAMENENNKLKERLEAIQSENAVLKSHVNTLMMESSTMMEKERQPEKKKRVRQVTEKLVLKYAKQLYYNTVKDDVSFVMSVRQLLSCDNDAKLFCIHEPVLPKLLIKSLADVSFHNLPSREQEAFKEKASHSLHKL